MSSNLTRKRRNFLATVGAAITGGMWSPTASAESSSGARANRTSIPYKPEVLVVGGGPAGIGAALGAARAGVKTLLLENHAFFGGVASWCLGMPINQMRPDSTDRVPWYTS